MALRSKLAAYSCGGSRGFGPKAYRVPFSPSVREHRWTSTAAMDQIGRATVKRGAHGSSNVVARDLFDASPARIEPARCDLDVHGSVRASDTEEIVASKRLALVRASGR